jgi:hypothetical protein
MITNSNGTRFALHEAETIRSVLDKYIDDDESLAVSVQTRPKECGEA